MPEMGNDRTLWAAVLLQVAADIAGSERDGLDYREAVAFVTSPGPYWAESRATVASHLGDMHVDDIQRAGRRWIAEREAVDPAPVVPLVTRPMKIKQPPKVYPKRRFVFDPNSPILHQRSSAPGYQF